MSKKVFDKIAEGLKEAISFAKSAPKKPEINCKDDDVLKRWFEFNLNQKPPQLVCPDCGGTDWYEGPQGGMSINMYCANDKCDARFNIAILNEGRKISVLQGERIGNSKLQ